MELTQEYLKQRLDYDPDTGVFTWRSPSAFNAHSGEIAGTLLPTGYVHIRLNYGRHYAHRLAWLYMYGTMPKEIDHINGVRDDNRIANLRPVTHSENARNKHGRLAPVNYHRKPELLYRLTIEREGEVVESGTFPSKAQIIQAILQYKYFETGQRHGRKAG